MTLAEAAIFSVGGTDYAFGLEWIAVSRGSVGRRYVRRQAEQLRATHLAWRPRAFQVGLARLAPDARPALLSPWRAAASVFADLPQPAAEPHSLIAAFAFLSGEFWVVASAQGRLLAGGDRLFTDAEPAQQHFRQLFARVPRWGSVFAPVAWGYPRANAMGPLPFLAAAGAARRGSHPWRSALDGRGRMARPGAALVRLDRQGGALWASPIGIAAAALLILSMLGALWPSVRPSRHAPPTPAATVLLAPWYPEPVSPAALLERCSRTLVDRLLTALTPGWDVSEIACDHTRVTVRLVAQPNTPLSSLLRFHPEAKLRGNDRSASIVSTTDAPIDSQALALPLPLPDRVMAEFGRLDEQTRAVNAFGQPLAPPDPPVLQMGMPRPRPYRLMSWSLQTAAPPTLWRPGLAAIPDLEVLDLTLKPGDDGWQWTVKGIAYVAP